MSREDAAEDKYESGYGKSWGDWGKSGEDYPLPHPRVRSYSRHRPTKKDPDGTRRPETGPQGNATDDTSKGEGSSKTEETSKNNEENQAKDTETEDRGRK